MQELLSLCRKTAEGFEYDGDLDLQSRFHRLTRLPPNLTVNGKLYAKGRIIEKPVGFTATQGTMPTDYRFAEGQPSDIYIQGGGPTGLLAAVTLKMTGGLPEDAKITVFEKRAKPTRNVIFNLRADTASFLKQIGVKSKHITRIQRIVTHERGRQSTEVPVVRRASNDDELLEQLPTHQIQTKVVEAELESLAKRMGIEVKRNCTLDFASGKWQSRGTGDDPMSMDIPRPRFLLVTDGANSAAKKVIGIKTEQGGLSQNFRGAVITAKSFQNHLGGINRIDTAGRKGIVLHQPRSKTAWSVIEMNQPPALARDHFISRVREIIPDCEIVGDTLTGTFQSSASVARSAYARTADGTLALLAGDSVGVSHFLQSGGFIKSSLDARSIANHASTIYHNWRDLEADNPELAGALARYEDEVFAHVHSWDLASVAKGRHESSWVTGRSNLFANRQETTSNQNASYRNANDPCALWSTILDPKTPAYIKTSTGADLVEATECASTLEQMTEDPRLNPSVQLNAYFKLRGIDRGFTYKVIDSTNDRQLLRLIAQKSGFSTVQEAAEAKLSRLQGA